ncbi:MAG: MBL fold metallo-hydrolase [Firmicutes bacterium]|nr:MBL fold metallo-hydrolase [Bacillota bacterium]
MFAVFEHGDITQFSMGPRWPGNGRLLFNAYLIDGLLIDTGPARFGSSIVRACRDKKVLQIVNTSGTSGCIGNNARLQREFSLPIRAHRQALPMVRQPQSNLSIPFWEGVWWGRPVPAKGRRIHSWVNTPRYRLRVISAPERVGHICLYEEEKGWLFSGTLPIDEGTRLSSLLEGEKINRVFSAWHGVTEGWGAESGVFLRAGSAADSGRQNQAG